jgi:hypothetical protein
MFKAEKFFAPVAISHKGATFYLHNDTMFNKQLQISITVMNGDDIKLNKLKIIDIKADDIVKIIEYPLAMGDAIKLSFDGNDYYFDNIKKLEQADITYEVADNGIIVKSNKYARNVFIDCDDTPNENYFNLLPNEEKLIKCNAKINSIKCENNIEFKQGKIKKALGQFLYRLKPMNIANAFYYEHN